MHLETLTTAQLALIPSGAPGVDVTLRAMVQLAREGKKNLHVRTRAVAVAQPCKQKDYACEVRSIHAFVRDSVRYVQDIDGVETLQAPEKTLEYMAGDCDDKSILLAALLKAIGHPSRFIAIGYTSGVFEHVYVETLIGNRWIALETTEPVPAGWEPPSPMIKSPPYYV